MATVDDLSLNYRIESDCVSRKELVGSESDHNINIRSRTNSVEPRIVSVVLTETKPYPSALKTDYLESEFQKIKL